MLSYFKQLDKISCHCQAIALTPLGETQPDLHLNEINPFCDETNKLLSFKLQESVAGR